MVKWPGQNHLAVRVLGPILMLLPAIALEWMNPWFAYIEGAEPGIGLRLLYVASVLGNRILKLVTSVAIWRSASNYEGLYDWAFVAKLFASFGVARLILELVGATVIATS